MYRNPMSQAVEKALRDEQSMLKIEHAKMGNGINALTSFATNLANQQNAWMKRAPPGLMQPTGNPSLITRQPENVAAFDSYPSNSSNLSSEVVVPIVDNRSNPKVDKSSAPTGGIHNTNLHQDAALETDTTNIASNYVATFQHQLQYLFQAINNLQERWSFIENALSNISYKLNNLEQYLRSNSVLWKKFPMPKSKKTPLEFNEHVVDTINKLLDLDKPLTLNNIDIAHVFRTRKKSEHKTVIIKFTNRWARHQVYYARKKLKSTGMSISDHLTAENIELLNLAKNSVGHQNAWSDQGRIYAVIHGRKCLIRSVNDLPFFRQTGSYENQDNSKQIPDATPTNFNGQPQEHTDTYCG